TTPAMPGARCRCPKRGSAAKANGSRSAVIPKRANCTRRRTTATTATPSPSDTAKGENGHERDREKAHHRRSGHRHDGGGERYRPVAAKLARRNPRGGR